MSNKFIHIFIVAALIFICLVSQARENSSELYKKGARLAINGQFDKAIRVFKRVIDISPYYCLGHYGLGKAYLYKYGKIDDAIMHLRKSVILDKKFVKGYFYLAMAYLLARKYIQAIHYFKRAYNYDDTFIEALFNIGVVYDIMDKSYESEIYFKRYIDEKLKEEEDIIF